MPAVTVDRPDSRADVVPVPVVESGCEACPHPLAAHDAVGRRYCTATASSQLDRDCVCRPG